MQPETPRPSTAGTFVILGAGPTGASAAITLREEGFEGAIVLIGADSRAPYERPLLSKEYLRGEVGTEETSIRPADFYDKQQIELKLSTLAQRIEPEKKVVVLDGGEQIGYDKVLVATGGRSRRPPIPGIDLPGVYDLRTMANADAIRAAASSSKQAVIAGMGFIGSEVAASLRTLGLEITVVESRKAPIGGVMGPEISAALEAAHREHGIEMHFEDRVQALEGSGHAERVITRNGLKLDCDFVVFGFGIEPVTDPVQHSGVRLDNGIVVDELFRTNVEDVYAAGDVANHFHPRAGRHIRVEHWQNALSHGAAAARSMLGKGRPYDEVPWFWSDQYDVNLQYAGFAGEPDQVVIRVAADKQFLAFYLKAGRLQSAAAINRGRDLRRAIPLIESGVELDADKLRDADVDLRTLA